jgi:pyruvate,water dikinase
MLIMRNFSGFREYPKFAIIQHFFMYKRAMLREADRLIQKGLIRKPDDIFFLYFDELRKAAVGGGLDYGVIAERRAAYAIYEKLTPPRVISSDGEVIAAEYDMGDVPAGALCGVPVSSGVVEGRARVVLKPEAARLEKGDILVTAFTDPSWTAAFVSISGLVTEVGGMMTHGAIVAREYGIPAVVSVENAATLIKDGQMIRINGSKGFVEIIE